MKNTEHKQFRCTYPGCYKVFNRRDYLERHATNHLSVKPYVCVLCNRHFSRKDLYDNHLTTKRHARVTHEAEQATYGQKLGQMDNLGMMEKPRQDKPNDTGMAEPSQPLSSAAFSLGRDFDENDQPGLPIYAPPRRSPLHLSGPGPGLEQTQGAISDDAGALGAERETMVPPESIPSPLTSTTNSSSSPYYQGSAYRFYQDPFGMDITGSGNNRIPRVDTLTEPSLDMNWPPNAYNIGKASSISLPSDPLSKPDSASSGRFSTHGMPFRLGSSISSSSGSRSERSETSTSEEYSGTDTDSQNSMTTVKDRLKHDMLQAPHNFSRLRETPSQFDSVPITVEDRKDAIGFTQQKQIPDITVASDPCDITAKYMSEDLEDGDDFVIKENILKDPRSATEAVEVSSDKRYAWFFDDIFNTKKSKLGYDRCYSDSIQEYETRSKEFAARDPILSKFTSTAIVNMVNPESNQNINGQQQNTATLSDFEDGANQLLKYQVSMMRPLLPERAAMVLPVLRETMPNLNSSAVDQWIKAAWIDADAVRQVVHLPTFDANNTHLALLAVLALIGMSLSEDEHVASVAHRAYAPTFLYAYESLLQLPTSLTPCRLDSSTVNVLQAFSLILRYERLALSGDGMGSSFIRSSVGKYVTDLFLGKALAAIPHVGEFSTPKKQQPIWATISSEGYMFHQGAEPDLQWREWVLVEAAKRTVHFSLYCDGISTLSTPKPNPISIFNMDIHMICPDSLWRARSSNEFFYISGPSGILTNVPFLGLVKSLIRFPRVAQNDDMLVKNEVPQVEAPWSIFALKSVAHALIMIVGKLSGLIPHGDEMLKEVMQSRSDPNRTGTSIFSKFDRQLQARLYRGLDVWYQYFSAAYGDVTDQILHVSGSTSIPIADEYDPPSNDDEAGIPQYALIIVLCHYSSFIFVHEDLPVVLQVTANLKSWLETHESKSLQMLLDYLYMPLYTNWIRTDEAKGMVSASALYLAWTHVAGNIKTGNHMFLSAMIYISVIVVWLYDFANNDVSQTDIALGSPKDSQRQSPRPTKVRLENFQFMDDAVDYIHAVYYHVSGQGPPPKTRAINSVLLLSACLLHRRRSTKPLVEIILQLLNVMDTSHTTEEFYSVVKQSTDRCHDRVAKAQEGMLKPRNRSPPGSGMHHDSSSGSEHSTGSDMDSDLANASDLNDFEGEIGAVV